jgi:hypothetical protein
MQGCNVAQRLLGRGCIRRTPPLWSSSPGLSSVSLSPSLAPSVYAVPVLLARLCTAISNVFPPLASLITWRLCDVPLAPSIWLLFPSFLCLVQWYWPMLRYCVSQCRSLGLLLWMFGFHVVHLIARGSLIWIVHAMNIGLESWWWTCLLDCILDSHWDCEYFCCLVRLLFFVDAVADLTAMILSSCFASF